MYILHNITNILTVYIRTCDISIYKLNVFERMAKEKTKHICIHTHIQEFTHINMWF